MRALLGPEGPLARAYPGYEERTGQLAMADAVERALAEDHVLLCEAGTGTGKTLAYLVPAILSGKTIVISTATKALEDQIFTKDLPLIDRTLRISAPSVLVKGLSNYLCLRRYNELRKSPSAALPRGSRSSLPILERWASETETGDVAELSQMSESDPLWVMVNSGSETRVGSACTYFDRCFVTRMKRDMEKARLLIVNHHLFFADLAVKRNALARGNSGAGVLPPYDAVIFDEAHQLEDIATDFFGTRISRARVNTMLRDSDQAFVSGGLIDPIFGGGAASVLVGSVRSASEAMFDRIARLVKNAEGRTPISEADAFSGEVLEGYHAFDSALEALEHYARENSRSEAIDMVAKRAGLLREETARIVDPAINQVKWVEARDSNVSMGASPVDVGRMFRAEVFEQTAACILTSATLTTSEKSPPDEGKSPFQFLKSRLGLSGELAFNVKELSVPSPFDYSRAAMLYTPRDLPEASDPGFAKAAGERSAELIEITGGGAFVLCTSLRGMKALADILKRRVKVPFMVQGEAPKYALLERFRASEHAVLVATMSFWEGVDVPGSALRLVIIEKLPFAVPTDPIVAARCLAIEKEGGNPFVEYSVPQAAITLKQGFGRLIRTRTDHGIVAILDKRIQTRGYGRGLISALPRTQRSGNIEDVRTFFQSIKNTQSPLSGASP